jgi:hypothetical protein
MIKNLVINGCSFTSDQQSTTTWAKILSKKFPKINYHNIAAVAAGNDYILQSTINFLEGQQFDPQETLVLIMWSGTGRKDLNISGEWWYHLTQHYRFGKNQDDHQYYLFSGGLNNSWTTNKNTKHIFDWLYKLSDPHTLCQSSMLNFVNLENYLKVQGYRYKFTSYVNYWDPESESNFNAGDYSIGHFCKDYPLYQKYDFSNWFFVNDKKDCLAEFAKDSHQLDNTGHPTDLGHNQFVEQVVMPVIETVLPTVCQPQ